ncbi:MAG TPA: hypothetical protein VEA81_14670 [Burkholderiaceae bacterium]|nr:hypothetical protein [Burkholderiaceae bacterium]
MIARTGRVHVCGSAPAGCCAASSAAPAPPTFRRAGRSRRAALAAAVGGTAIGVVLGGAVIAWPGTPGGVAHARAARVGPAPVVRATIDPAALEPDEPQALDVRVADEELRIVVVEPDGSIAAAQVDSLAELAHGVRGSGATLVAEACGVPGGAEAARMRDALALALGRLGVHTWTMSPLVGDCTLPGGVVLRVEG